MNIFSAFCSLSAAVRALALVGVPRALGVVGCFHQQQPSYMQGNASLK